MEASGLSTYIQVNFYMDTVPSQLKFGFCLPKNCDETAIFRVQHIVHRNIQPLCFDLFKEYIFDRER
jgi:hypothetical protein